MLRRRPDLSWPLLVLLLALFFLTVRAPRRWEAIARRESLNILREVPKASSVESLITHVSAPTTTPDAIPTSFASMGGNSSVDAPPAASSGGGSTENGEAAIRDGNEVVLLAPSATPTAVLGDPNTDKAADAAMTPAQDSASPADSLEASVGIDDSAEYKLSPMRELANVAMDLSSESSDRQVQVDDAKSVAMAPVSEKVVAAEPSLVEPLQNGPDSSPLDSSGAVAIKPPYASEVRVLRDDPGTDDKPAISSLAKEDRPADALKPNALKALEAAPDTSSRNVAPEPITLDPTRVKPAEVESLKVEPVQNVPPEPAPAVPTPNRPAAAPALPSDARALARNWEEPTYLLARIEQLDRFPEAQPWAVEAARLVRSMGPALASGDPKALDIVEQLNELTSEAAGRIPGIHDYAAAQELCRVGHAVDRHVVVWRQIAQMGGLEAANAPAPSGDPQAMNRALTQIDDLTKNSAEGAAWRKYLMTDSLRQWFDRRKSAHERMPHEMGQQLLKRLNQVALSSHQRQFITSEPLTMLHHEVVRQTAEPVEAKSLLHDLEVYEQSGLPSDARRLARDCQYLSVSSGTAQQQLGRSVESFYRNANMRMAVSADLLNRMTPKRDAEYAPISDTVQGVPVRGQSLTASDVSIKLLPDPNRVALALVVNGEVASLTQSTAGPATFYNDSQATYVVRKPMEVTLQGIRVWPTEVEVDNNSHLQRITTSMDKMPLIGGIVRNVAREKHDEQLPAAEAEVKQKIAAKAKQRVENETNAQINNAAQKLRDNLLNPMDQLLLDPMMIAAETNEQRFSMRIRLAGSDQLGGYTPRPQAPADSLASLQIHESALNNILERLELEGNTFTLSELGQRIAQRLHRPAPKPADPEQEDVRISFAAQNALHVRCTNGRLEVSLAVAKLSKGMRKWKDFEVRAYYRPEVRGRDVELARDGVVQLPTPHLSTGSQIVLRGVFSKVFSQKENVKVTPPGFVNQPKLDGLSITQFVIEDGWVGAAIGPSRVAQLTSPARQ